MVYAPIYTAGDLTSMGIDTAGGVYHETAAQSGNVASLGILSGTTMPLLANTTKQSGMMLTAITPTSAVADAEKASEAAKNASHVCQNCKSKSKKA